MNQSTAIFRILVVDDEEPIYQVIEGHLGSYGEDVQLDYAPDVAAASQRLEQRLYDLAIVDIYGKNGLEVGTEICRRIEAADVGTRVLFMTKVALKEDGRRLLQLTGSPAAKRLVGLLDKSHQQFERAVQDAVGREVKQFRRCAATIEGLDELARQIRKQRHRYRGGPAGQLLLRRDHAEICTEVDRLVRKLYAELPGEAERRSKVSVALRPMERRGLSAAVVSHAVVSIKFGDLPQSVGGHKTVLKIGPKADILEEAARFAEYVKYGVELAQRVELLGVASADALGGLVYSFAGGLYNNDLLPLDEALVEDLGTGDLTLSTTVLESLFRTRNWYSIRVAPLDVGTYFDQNLRNDLQRSCSDGAAHLLALDAPGGPRIEKVEHPTSSPLRITTATGTTLEIPDSSALGQAILLHKAPACLAHGDMHGGNVLLECSTPPGAAEGARPRTHHRTCLIDFRNSGPAPRCIDAVSLESSIRLAEVESILRRGGGPVGDGDAPVPPALATELVDRYEAEKSLYRAVFREEGSVPDEDWARLAATVLRGLREAFDGEVTLQEYLITSLRYTIRSLGFRLSPPARYRISAWLGAQYALACELERQP